MSEKSRILVVNPGSTSTKVAVYEGDKQLFQENVHHEKEMLEKYPDINDQYLFRLETVVKILENEGYKMEEFAAVSARGGLMKPIPGGTYGVSQQMVDDCLKGVQGKHASNIGSPIAFELHKKYGFQAFVVDPVVVDEFNDIARISGHPLIKRNSLFHALNVRAVARRVARYFSRELNEMNLIVAHLGGGITVNCMEKGRVIDGTNGLWEGPMTPERSGSLPTGHLIDLCFSGDYTSDQLKKICAGKGGLTAYTGSNNCKEIEDRALAGDKESKLILDGMIYQIAKDIGALATVVNGRVDYVVITGGQAKSKYLINELEKRCQFIAPLAVYAGEDEMSALAEGAFRVLSGEEVALNYQQESKSQ